MKILPVFALFVFAAPVQAQRDPVVIGDSVIVTAERIATSLLRSTASVSRLDAADIAKLPGATVADVLRQLPGFAIVNFDGLGFDPQLMVRGFYGAGEAEYVTVLVDGRPVNQVQSGVVSWDALPLSGVRAIEVLRGSASSLYGDAAVGGVINIITGVQDGPRGSVAGGSYDTWRGSLSLGTPRFAASGAFDRTGGFRDHAERTTARANVRAGLMDDGRGSVGVYARAHSREYEEPGPLASSAADASTSSSLFRFDFTQDRLFNAGLDATRDLGRFDASGGISGEYRDIDATRTLELAPGFGDTRARDVLAKRVTGNAQLSTNGLLSGADNFLFGAEVLAGMLESSYYAVFTGGADEYGAQSGNRGDLSASGSGGRTSAALYALYTAQATDVLRFSLGARYDWLEDDFSPDDGEGFDASHSAFSPKAGINLRYAEGGHVYANASRSFKAPTLDQLFDQRPIPVPFPPFSLTTSNPTLVPQYGNSFEGGIYHNLDAGGADVAFNLSAYQIDMRDELDFDVSTLTYVNIGRSRHRGIESGVRVGRGNMSAFGNYTLQDVTIQAGDNEGNGQKAIPKHVVNAGASLTVGGVDVSAVVTRTGTAWIDDANSTRLPAWTRVDARLGYNIRGFGIFADVRNIFDTRYSTVGFYDPSGSGEIFEYPAAGRVFEVGIRR